MGIPKNTLLGTLATISILYPGNSLGIQKSGKNLKKPNIILILADDMGFSDIDCYGGEIHTPNINNLAKTGIRYSQFYNAARCCPTRASLMTGLYPHQAGMGWMTNADLGTPAYRGDLSKNAVTIAEVLRTAGYDTYMTGKWHLSSTRKDNGGVIDNWPVQRGFNRYFGTVEGAGNYFNLPVYSNNKKYKAPENFYFTNALGDSSAMFIGDHFTKKNNEPMFMYVAFTAPHWPLQALEKDIEKYKGVYDAGWDAIRKQRLEKQVQIGLWTKVPAMTPRDESVPAWETLTADQKREFTRRMQIYAAQVDVLDQNVGKIVAELKKVGQFDNTVIFFLADNGGCAEYITSGKSKDLFGNLEDTFESYRINWANVSNTPYRMYKHWVHQGGISTPLIVHWPNGIDKSLNNIFIRDYGHITDIMATCVELSGARYPRTYNGHKIVPMQGTSLVKHFSNQKNGRGPIFWEHEANISMRDGKWKLVAKTPEDSTFSAKRLELYNIDEDPTELHDLAGIYPQKRDSLYKAWEKWAHYVKVYPMDTREYNIRSQAFKRKINGEFDVDFGDWNVINPKKIADFTIDRSNRISGKNAALISILNTGEKPTDAALAWGFNTAGYEEFDFSLKAMANRTTTLTVRVEEIGNPKNKIAEQVCNLDTKVKQFSFKTQKIDHPAQYRLVFLAGDQPAGDKIWLDSITLTPAEKK